MHAEAHLSALVNVPTLNLGDSQNLLGFPVCRLNVQRQGEAIDGLLEVGLSEVRMGLCCNVRTACQYADPKP